MKRILICIIALAAITLQATAQEQEKKNEEGFLFTVIKENPITPVKNQSSTGTVSDTHLTLPPTSSS